LGEYYYRVTGVNSLTESITAATAFTATPAATPLPPPWADRDIGTVGGAGAAGLAGGTFTAVGAGIIGGGADGFHFVYQPLTGDGSITARVAAVENTASTAKAGVMIRESLTAGSRSVLLALTPGSGAAFVTRSATGGTSTTASTTGPAVPYWTRLVRAG